MKKLVDGVEVEMTPEEVAARQAEEAAWEAGKAEREKKAKDKSARDAALKAIDHTKKLTTDELDVVARAWLAERRGE